MRIYFDMIHDETDKTLHDALLKYWGYTEFRGVQPQTIRSVLAGRDTLSLMPTGAGKSLTYQLPTMVRKGICIVVTPLIALMKDQVDALQKRHINAVAIYSGLTPKQIDIALDNCVFGDVKFLYIAPERIASDIFRARVKRMDVSLIAVDEAHCISQWGYDFRPSYLRIADIRKLLPEVPVLALTASATERVAADIMDKLEFTEPNIIRGDYSRPNLSFAVRHTDDKKGQLTRVLNNVPGSGIVYMRTREGVETLARELEDEGVSALYYHAGLPHAERTIRQAEWMSGKKRVMVATTAFGMGVDKADARFVVHYDLCSSLEEYYQEAGRAGRDGARSYAVMLVGSDDADKVLRRYRAEFPNISTIKDVYSKIYTYLSVGVGDGRQATFNFDPFDFCARYKIFAGTLHNSVKILEQNGYMVYIDEDENPARLMFCISRDELYNIRTERADLDDVLRAILRLYTGVFTDFKAINIQEIALYAGCTEEQVKEKLKMLWQLHVIRYIPKNRSPLLYSAEARLPEEDIYISPLSYRIRKEMASERLERMLEYADNTEVCRSVLLQGYFGEKDAEACGVCDVCRERKKRYRAKHKLFADEPNKGGEDSPEKQIWRIIEQDAVSVKELVERLSAEPDEMLAIIDRLMDEGKISVSKSGLIVRK